MPGLLELVFAVLLRPPPHRVIPTEEVAATDEWRDLLFRRVTHLTAFRNNLPHHEAVEGGYYVCIFASRSRTLYIGVTNNLGVRVRQHRSDIFGGFTSDYNFHRLVYYERFAWIQDAFAREKQLKRWRREKKLWLIERENLRRTICQRNGQASAVADMRSSHKGEQQVPPLARRGGLGRDDTLMRTVRLSECNLLHPIPPRRHLVRHHVYQTQGTVGPIGVSGVLRN